MTDVLDKDGKFSIFVPIDKIEKSDDSSKSKGTLTISGLASDDSLDWQGERVNPLGIDTTYFDKQGFIDWEHDTSKKIGVPIESKVNQKGLFVKAKLFKNMPEVQDMVKLIDNLKAAGTDRTLGFSIEGQVNQRDPVNPSIIQSLMLTGMAVTASPANKDSSFKILTKSIHKSNLAALQAGHSINPADQTGGEALKPESLAHCLTNLSYGLTSLKSCDPADYDQTIERVANLLDANKSVGDETNALFLQVFKGLSRSDAMQTIKSINQSQKGE